MTPQQREAALRLADDMDTPISVWADQVAHLLRELAAEPVQEPVAWIVPRAYGSGLSFTKLTEPENWNDDYGEWYCKPLYTAPQQRKPLTDDEALALIRATPQEDVTQEGWIRRQRLSWVRAIERAITGEQK